MVIVPVDATSAVPAESLYSLTVKALSPCSPAALLTVANVKLPDAVEPRFKLPDVVLKSPEVVVP